MSQVMVAGQIAENVEHLVQQIEADGRYAVSSEVTSPEQNGGAIADPNASVLILLISGTDAAELAMLRRTHNPIRVPVIVVADELVPSVMRCAMQAGARDYLGGDANLDGLFSSISAVMTESQGSDGDSEVIGVISAAGGNGASTVAINLAHHFVDQDLDTLVLDLDLMYASTTLMLDVSPTRSLTEAAERVDELDVLALDGYFTAHKSGLKLLSAKPSGDMADRDLCAQSLPKLLNLCRGRFPKILVDVPQQLDGLSLQALTSVDRIVMVVQQNLASLRNASRLLDVLLQQGVHKRNVVFVVNRYDKKAAIELGDIEKTLRVDTIATIPNEYSMVSESVELGVPYVEYAPKSGAAKAIVQLSERFGVDVEQNGHAGLSGAFSRLLRR